MRNCCKQFKKKFFITDWNERFNVKNFQLFVALKKKLLAASITRDGNIGSVTKLHNCF